MSEFDAVLFDAGGVLVVPNPDTMAACLQPYSTSTTVEALERAHYAGVHAIDHSRVTELSAFTDWSPYNRAYAQTAAVTEDRLEMAVAALDATFTHWVWTQPVSTARLVLAELYERGVPIGVVSNSGGQAAEHLELLGICRVDGEQHAGTSGKDAGVPVRCVVDSFVVGVEKPDPAIFSFALDALGLPASTRIAYVGDTVTADVRGARAAGLTPLLYDPHGFHRERPVPDIDYRRLADLSEVLQLV
jgi:putative hydrolase of the HAD superfamily